MTVYVDDARKPFGRMLMCHMLADSPSELHAMAKSLGLDERWFHRGHYNICQSYRKTALALGAVQITQRKAARMRKAQEIAP